MRKFVFILGVVSADLFIGVQWAWAWPPTYGLEFNLKSKALQSAWLKRMDKYGNSYQGQAPSAEGVHRIARELMEKFRASCQPDCVVTSKVGKFGFEEWRFEFPSGFGFNLSV
ncbi:hypothetical protein EBZ37_15135, partial [bacterium]|nr:hypothetical protein [bacterium]